ncbi:MAG: FlgB family protein [Paracoccus sp. (in: a-proteobacteria)]|uniref:FlgB family protein n=1 Tax=Paracoccus sp. TaxID=267 RepID=UPI0026E0900B|nr:FlgB family protein [Paracoccus sp. (in: a-proteobacteria)]MDO5611809.1 FlgB family protein [Paracoccus sp. (in: a-proteobacteria)]MDO5631796.1 FlgB family protein [Paracoccus sp. (in: a-proteobacteria)]
MFERITTLKMARAMTNHAVARQVVTARNIANADTPGYQAKDLEKFADSYGRPSTSGMNATRARHITAPLWSGGSPRIIAETEGASPNGNTVTIEDEMMRSASVKRQHDLALGIYKSGLDMLRTSLGRG